MPSCAVDDGVGRRERVQVGHLLVQGDILTGAWAERQADVGEQAGRVFGLEVVICACSRVTVFCRMDESVEEETELTVIHATACRREPNIVLMVEISLAEA